MRPNGLNCHGSEIFEACKGIMDRQKVVRGAQKIFRTVLRSGGM